jgi:hypothetical protein
MHYSTLAARVVGFGFFFDRPRARIQCYSSSLAGVLGVDVVVCQESSSFLVLHTERQGVGPRSSVAGIFHSSTKGGAGEDEEGTWRSRRSASEVVIKNKYSGCGACKFMGTSRA